MITTSQQLRLTASTVFLPAALVGTESDLQSRYLGDDTDEICQSAFASNDPRIMASSLHPLETRHEAFTAWRVKQVEWLLRSVADFSDFFANATPEIRGCISAGEVALAQIDEMISTACHERLARQSQERERSKNDLREAVGRALLDVDESQERMQFPGFLVILENGRTGLFRKRQAALQCGRESGGRFLMGGFQPESFMVYAGPEAD